VEDTLTFVHKIDVASSQLRHPPLELYSLNSSVSTLRLLVGQALNIPIENVDFAKHVQVGKGSSFVVLVDEEKTGTKKNKKKAKSANLKDGDIIVVVDTRESFVGVENYWRSFSKETARKTQRKQQQPQPKPKPVRRPEVALKINVDV